MFWILPITFLILFEVIADVFAKEFSLKGDWYFWIGAILAYIVANIFWLWAIRSGSELARGAIIFSVGSALLASVIGIYFYSESLNKFQVAGIILGIVSLILIFWE